MPTAAQIAMGRNTRLSAGLLLSVAADVPLLDAFDVRTTTETEFLTLSRDSLPSSSFVRLGEGVSGGEASLSIRKASCSRIGGLVSAPVDSARMWDNAHAESGFTWFGLQADSRVKADMKNIEKQLIQGLANDALGFPGANDITPFIAANLFTMAETAAKYEYKRPVLNAGSGVSLTANTASSVYSFCFGPLESQLIWGNDNGGDLFQFSEIVRQFLANPNDSTKQILTDMAQIVGHVGFAVGGFSPDQVNQAVPTQYSLRRAANLTADVGAKLTDAIMGKLVGSHGPAKRPSLIAMASRSGEQLAASRAPTSVNINMGPGNADAQSFVTYPEPPKDWRGIPIVYPLCITESGAVEA